MASQLAKKAGQGKRDVKKTNAEIDLLLSLMKRFDEVKLPVKHRFAGGIYSREMQIPKGVILVGKIHKKADFFAVLKGKIRVFSAEHGWRILEAGFIGASGAGVQRVGFAVEDTVCATWHATRATKVRDAVRELFTMRSVRKMTDKAFRNLCEKNAPLKMLAE